MKNTQITLRGSTALSALVLASALFAAPAMAQDTSTSTTVPATQEKDDQDGGIVVTGSLFRRTDTETASPVTVLSAETLQQRGINTVAEAVQRLSANGAGTITQGWNTGSNFATGANAVSLRGLTVQSTLTIFDGMRMAPYPLADDGHRNFVDLNAIPNAIIERIEVLRDGASSTYGADAVAGVVNVITKKQITGLHLNGSAGISQEGDAGEQRLDATWGFGDLNEQGFNFYVNAEYQRQDALWARDRGYPYNTSNLNGVCNEGRTSCMFNGIRNSYTAGRFNGLSATPVPTARPVDAAGAATGLFQLITPPRAAATWHRSTSRWAPAPLPAAPCSASSTRVLPMASSSRSRSASASRAASPHASATMPSSTRRPTTTRSRPRPSARRARCRPRCRRPTRPASCSRRTCISRSMSARPASVPA